MVIHYYNRASKVNTLLQNTKRKAIKVSQYIAIALAVYITLVVFTI